MNPNEYTTKQAEYRRIKTMLNSVSYRHNTTINADWVKDYGGIDILISDLKKDGISAIAIERKRNGTLQEDSYIIFRSDGISNAGKRKAFGVDTNVSRKFGHAHKTEYETNRDSGSDRKRVPVQKVVKKVAEYDSEWNKIRIFDSVKDVAEQYPVKEQTIYSCIHNSRRCRKTNTYFCYEADHA